MISVSYSVLFCCFGGGLALELLGSKQKQLTLNCSDSLIQKRNLHPWQALPSMTMIAAECIHPKESSPFAQGVACLLQDSLETA